MGGLVAAGAKSLAAFARENDDAYGFVPAGAVERIDQFIAGLAAESVVLVRAIDGDAGHAVAGFIADVGIGAHVVDTSVDGEIWARKPMNP
ncbi:hypothetical protein D3C78_1381010 [compost metagenome]